MKKIIKKYKDLPFEEGKTYQTKFQTGEKFLLKRIVWNKERMILFEGIYENSPHIGMCPLNVDRLIPDKVEDGEICVCGKCGEPL